MWEGYVMMGTDMKNEFTKIERGNKSPTWLNDFIDLSPLRYSVSQWRIASANTGGVFTAKALTLQHGTHGAIGWVTLVCEGRWHFSHT